jgi:hypothetical protein
MHNVVSSGLKEAERHAMRGDNVGQKDVQHACRSMSLTLDRGLTTSSGRVHSLRDANRPGLCGVPLSLRQICSRGRCASMPRQSDRAATARSKPRFMVLSSNRTTPQLTRRRTPRRPAISRNFLRLAAKNRPSNRSPRSFSI